MSFTIAELFQSSCYQGRTSHAAPARSDHTGVSSLCATVFAPGVVPCTVVAGGGDFGSQGTHRDGGLARDGLGG